MASVKVPPVAASSSRSSKPTIIPASAVARTQTVLSAAAFLSALAVGSALHYKKIVKNGVAKYPDEWLPSVSATIGDWYPERNIFQILIALTAAPRFVLIFLGYHFNQSRGLFLTGVLRTLTCGGWVYITSSDSGLAHDVFMISYIVLNIPWMVGVTSTSRSLAVRKKRTLIAVAFFTTILPLVYFYIQHKVHRIPGAYSYYAIFEWSLIFFDVFFDSVAEKELRDAQVHITLGPSTSSGSLTLSKDTDKDTVMDSAEKVVEKSSDEAMKDALSTALAPATIDTQAKKCNHGRAGLSFLSDLYLSYVFWSIFTALIPTLFYFSVWELGVAGQELALLSLLSPGFLSFPSLAVLLSNRTGQTVAYGVQFVALLAYLSNDPLVRLAIVTVSCVVMMQREVVLLSGLVAGEGKKDGKGVGYRGIVATLGFAVASLSKHANHGNNPIWPFIDPKNGGYNELGLALSLLALFEFHSRKNATTDAEKKEEAAKAVPQAKYTKKTPSFASTFFGTSVPLGSLVFSLHNLLSDPSSLVAASWTGWENGVPRGPLPHIHGSITLAVCSLGGILGVLGLARSSMSGGRRRNPFLSAPWFVLGCAGTYGMYALRNWPGYLSSLGLVVVLFSAAPAIFAKAGLVARGGDEDEDKEASVLAQKYASQVGRTFANAMFVYILLNLASIFTVAYAFVPGGWVFRERTDAVLTAQLVCLAFAFDIPGLSSHSVSAPKPTTPPSVRRRAGATFSTIAIVGLLVTLYHLPMVPIKPHQPAARLVNAGIWTVHFGINNEGHDSQRGMRDLVKDMKLDIVGLLETDLHRTSFGHRDLSRIMVEELGYNVDIGPGPNEHTWGAVLLTKFPIINTTHHLLPSPGGELAPAIESVLDIYGTLVTVVVSHNGQEEDPLDRELQSTELARIMRESPYPVIFLGYVVTKPHMPRPHPYQIMTIEGNVHDIDDSDKDRWCEYIFYRGLYRTAYARVSRGIITDTEMQIGQFVVPREGVVTIDDAEARYIKATKDDMSPAHWFPEEYHGNRKRGGKNKHYYHVFKTPKYFKLPENAVV